MLNNITPDRTLDKGGDYMTRIYEQYVNFIKLCDYHRYPEAEELLSDIIVNVLEQNAIKLNIRRSNMTIDNAFDYFGEIINDKIKENIAIELKVSNNSINLSRINSILVSAKIQNIKNVILVSNKDFISNDIKTAFDIANKSNFNLQIFGRKELDQWFSAYKKPENFINDKTVHFIIKECSRMLAKRIAAYPDEFMNTEWRDLERIIATVFSDFGYDVELTPSSKDGGKDVIVWYHGESYIIEIKHWNKENKVGKKHIRDFLNIVIRENRKLGLYLSSSGYTTNAFETMTYIDKINFRYGDKSSMQLLLKMYERVNNGFYVPSNNLEKLIEDISCKVE